MIVLFDADDTLWSTQALYEDAKQRYSELLKHVGIDVPDLIEPLDQLDSERVAQHGLTVERFIGSMILLYERLSTERGVPIYDSVIERIRLLESILRQPPRLFDDTVPVLVNLSHRVKLYLVTAGDYSVQQAKILNSGLAPYFTHIFIIPVKTVETLRSIVDELGVDPGRCWFVGNSPRSDVIPALSVGMNTILVARPLSRWKYDEVPEDAYPPPSGNRFVTVQSLAEAEQVIIGYKEETDGR